jgi:excisionase family DNA binding protein
MSEKLLYSRKEAAQLLSISLRTLDNYVALKQIKTRRKGRRVLISHGELVRFSRMDHT